ARQHGHIIAFDREAARAAWNYGKGTKVTKRLMLTIGFYGTFRGAALTLDFIVQRNIFTTFPGQAGQAIQASWHRDRRAGKGLDHGQEFRGPPAGRQRERGRDAEVARRLHQGRAGDRRRSRGLFEEVVRGFLGGNGEAVRRQVVRQGDRSADRVRQERL